MKKETLEEAKDRKYPLTNALYLQLNTAIRTGFEEGAKWQEQRMYSEEEVEKMVRAAYTFGEKEFKYFGAFKEWFEQFKKK